MSSVKTKTLVQKRIHVIAPELLHDQFLENEYGVLKAINRRVHATDGIKNLEKGALKDWTIANKNKNLNFFLNKG